MLLVLFLDLQDYKTKEELYLKRAAELDEITTQRNEMRALYDQLKKRRTTDFLAGETVKGCVNTFDGVLA